MGHPHANFCMVETFREILDARLPLGISPRQLLAQGARQQALRARTNHHLQPLNQTVERLHHAIAQQKGLSVVSLGDSEVFTLALGHAIDVKQFHSYLSAAGIRNAGNSSQLFRDRDLLIEGLQHADVLGVPFMMHYEVQSLLFKILPKILPQPRLRKVALTDSAIGYILAAHGHLYQLLHRRPSPRILLIGNKAPELAEKLSHLNITGTVNPVNGLTNLQEVEDKINRHTFDLALVAAGIASLPLCGHIRHKLNRVALDIGKLPELLTEGLFHWDHPQPSWRLDPSHKHRLMPMTVWSHFIYKHYPVQEYIPIGHSPGKLLQLGANLQQTNSISYREFAKQLKRAYQQRRGLSFISSPPPPLLDKHHLMKRTIVGLPLSLQTSEAYGPTLSTLNKHPVRYVEDHALLFLASQFNPFLQKFLLNTNPTPRVMIIGTGQIKPWETLLRESGINIVGLFIVDSQTKVPKMVKQVKEDSPNFDIALVSAGDKTPSICLLTTKKLDKITIDSRQLALVHQASPVFNRFWQGIPHRSVARWRDLAGINLYQKPKTRSD